MSVIVPANTGIAFMDESLVLFVGTPKYSGVLGYQGGEVVLTHAA